MPICGGLRAGWLAAAIHESPVQPQHYCPLSPGRGGVTPDARLLFWRVKPMLVRSRATKGLGHGVRGLRF